MKINFSPRPILNPSVERRLLEEGVRFLQSSQMEMAEDRFKKLLINNPKHADALNLLGIVRAQSGDLKRPFLSILVMLKPITDKEMRC